MRHYAQVLAAILAVIEALSNAIMTIFTNMSEVRMID